MSLLTNLSNYYKLDEASGNALDAHGTGTLNFVSAVGSATGKLNGCRDFEFSSGSYLAALDSVELSTGDIDWSMQAWVQLESKQSPLMTIASKWSGVTATSEYILYWDSTADKFIFTVYGSGGVSTGVTASNFGAPSIGVWYLVHVWHDSVNNEIGISVNAGTPNTAAHSAGTNDTTQTFFLGIAEGGLYGWDGLIDEVGFWKRVLTSQERADLYNLGLGLAYSRFSIPTGGLLTNLVAAWELDESGGPRNDSHGYNSLLDSTVTLSATGLVHTLAADFEAGSNNYLSRPSSTELSIGDIDFTIEAWVKLESEPASYPEILGKWGVTDAGQRDYTLYYNSVADRMEFGVSGTGLQSGVSTVTANNFGAITTGVWYHVVAWHDATANQIGISVNNGTANTVSHSAGIHLGTTDFAIGGRRSWDGLIGPVRFWKNRMLSSTDRTNLYNGGAGLAYPLTVSGVSVSIPVIMNHRRMQGIS